MVVTLIFNVLTHIIIVLGVGGMFRFICTTGGVGFFFSAIVIPAGAGTLVSWYCLRSLKKSDDIAPRLVTLIASFVLVMFTDVYATTFVDSPGPRFMATTLVPNLTFTIGLSLYVILMFLPKRAVMPAPAEKAR